MPLLFVICVLPELQNKLSTVFVKFSRIVRIISDASPRPVFTRRFRRGKETIEKLKLFMYERILNFNNSKILREVDVIIIIIVFLFLAESYEFHSNSVDNCWVSYYKFAFYPCT